MNVSIYMKGYYEDFCGFGLRKNKANLADPKGVEQRPVDDGRKRG